LAVNLSEKKTAVAKTSIRVLIIEDNPADAELACHELRKAGFEIKADVVQTPEEFLEKLRSHPYDIVLADYRLPGWSGMDALEMVQKEGKEVPFILLSGTVGEETAVECIKKGATDYVLKDRLKRLPQVVGRALKEKAQQDEGRRAVEKLRLSEEQFRLISENVADLIVVVDLEGRRVYNSPSYKEILGDPNTLRGTDSFNEIHPDDRDNVKRIFEETARTGVGQRAEYRFVLKDGSFRYIESQGSVIRNREGKPANILVVSRDVTERKKLEQQLLQSQKMEAIGQLAGGVAHDFNNLLTVISGFGQLALESLADDAPNRGHLEQVLRASDRAASLTRQLLAFSRRQTLQPKVLNLNEVVTNVEKMLRRLIGENIELVAVPTTDLGRIKADAGQVEQVIMNLAVNARDAMPKGGKLTIETANVELDAAYARAHTVAKPGPYVMLAVSDTGSGMDKNTQAHIFEPFFTTKEKGKGTGLGLSTVYGIVKQSGGNIWVYSEPGRGTTFKVYFPEIQEDADVIETSGAAPRSLKGTENILVVEDEEPIRKLVRAVLESRGYNLLLARDGEEAIAISEGHKGPINIMLTDLVMPGLSGLELARRLAPKRPEMKMLYMSGYTDDTVVRNGLLESSVAFIQKPFTPDALARKVREVLDAPHSSK